MSSNHLLQRTVALQSSALFADLPADDLLPVASMCSERDLADGEHLFRAGELGDAMYVVAKGAVRVEKKGRILAELGAGECVGEMAVLDWEPRSADVVAKGPTTLIRLDRNDLLDLVSEYPELIRGLVQVLTLRMREGNQDSA